MSEEYREDTTSIQVSFPVAVNITRDQTMRLVALIDEICDAYEEKHTDRTMWPSGIGGQITSMPMTREDEAAGVPMTVDMQVLSIDCFERERYDTEHTWMTLEETKKFFPTHENPMRYCKRCGRPKSTLKKCQAVRVGPRAVEPGKDPTP